MNRPLIMRLIRWFIPSTAATRQDLADELNFHLSARAEANVADGMSPIESEQAALDRFGNIHDVVQECTDNVDSPLRRWYRVHLLITAALVAILGTFVYRLGSNRADTMLAATGYPVAETTGDIHGRVRDVAGNPISNVHLLAVVKTWPNKAFRQNSFATITDQDGRFQINDVYAPNRNFELQIAAVADNRAITSQYVSMTTGDVPPIEFVLCRAKPLFVQFESLSGEPIADVSAFAWQRQTPQGQRHVIYFCSANPIIQESDPDGQMMISHFPSGDRATLYVRFPMGEWETREFVVPANDQPIVLKPSHETNELAK